MSSRRAAVSSPVECDPEAAVVIGAEPGLVVRVLALGATVQRLEATCGDGVRRNLVLGHQSADDYASGSDYLGGIVGRYANRIAAGRFSLDDREVQAHVVDRGHYLHGDPDGLHRRAWSIVAHKPDGVRLRLVSPDGDQGFPGRLVIEAAYVVEGARLSLELSAVTDAPTVVNLAAHPYFNLGGHSASTMEGCDVREHDLRVCASRYLPVDETGIPLGNPVSVAGTPFDFREPVRVGTVLDATDPQVWAAGGIDHTLVLDEPDGPTALRPVAWLSSRHTWTTVEIATDQPGLQVYTANGFDGARSGSDGLPLLRHAGIALETQHFPDSPNRTAYPSTVVRPGETYRSRTTWTFARLVPDVTTPRLDHRRPA